jgi:hypothetical protein
VDDKTTITVKEIPLPLWRRFKAFAAERGLSIQDAMVELLTLALDGKKGRS